MHDPASLIEKDIYKFLWDFDIKTDYLVTAKRPHLIIINKNTNKKTCKIVDFTVPADQRMKLKENEKKNNYLEIARELKKIWNMKVAILPIVFWAFGTVTKGLLKGQEYLKVGGREKTIQSTTLLRMARMLRRVLHTWGHFLSLKLQGKFIS